MSYGGIKDLSRRSASDKVLREKAFDVAKNKKVWCISTWTCFNRL